MSILGDVIGGVLGWKSDKKANKLNKEQLKIQKDLANRQIDISKYIEQLSKDIIAKQGDVYDPYGGYAKFNPETKRYEYSIGGVQKDIQDASDQEELLRQTKDQALRRSGLNDYERQRRRSSDEGDRVFDEVLAAKRGINRVDARLLGSQLRTDRTRAVNAGYDDAERAAQTLQLRTGSSAVSDAIANLARDRMRAQATAIGSPEVEGLQMANEINQGRDRADLERYQLFGNEGKAFYDASYNPASYDQQQYARLGDLMKFDLSKYDLGMGGSGNAASTIGNAAAGLNKAYSTFTQNRIANPTGKLIMGIDSSIGDNFTKALKSAFGMGG